MPEGERTEVAQAAIERLLVLRQEAQEIQTSAAKKEKELAAEEERLKAALQGGATVAPGRYRLMLETETTARSVRWKEVVVQHLGKAFAEWILADTPEGKREILRVLQEVRVDGAGAGA